MASVALSREERLALTQLVASMQQDELDGILFVELGESIATFGSLADPMPATAFKFVKWSVQRPQDLALVIQALCDHYGQRPELPLLQSILRKTERLAQAAPAHPCEAYLVGSAVMVNRSHLRAMLRQLVDGYARPLIRVLGPPKSGRTQSWQLIRHVAQDYIVVAHRLDLDAWVVEQRTLPELVGALVDTCGLAGFQQPTAEGVTPQTLGQRFATRVAECLENRAPAAPLWLVFDSLDRNLAPDLGAFIRRLAELALQPGFTNCTIFLLGPAGDADAPASPAVMSETLGPFLDNEIEAAAAAVNGLGTTPLDGPALARRIQEVTVGLGQVEPVGRAAFVSERLTELRYAVGAP